MSQFVEISLEEGGREMRDVGRGGWRGEEEFSSIKYFYKKNFEKKVHVWG